MRRFLTVNGVTLCCVAFGGVGPPVLLLHGLCGRGNEWRTTAGWLRDTHQVFALDQRGHGVSDKATKDYSRDAYVRDVIAVIEQLDVGPVCLVGQSMGGINAFLAAARRPDLVRALIVIEATARDTATPAQVGIAAALAQWPLPFPTLADARDFFHWRGLAADTWLEILQEHPQDGYWPQFRIPDMIASVADLGSHDYLADWAQIQCPTLVVGGGKSWLPQAPLRDMAAALPHAAYVVIPNAGHDVHLDDPDAWHTVAHAFLQRHCGGR